VNRDKPKAVKDVKDVREFFSHEVKNALKKNRLATEPESADYLVDLMVRYMESEIFFAKDEEGRPKHNILAEMYSEFLNGNPEQKRVVLRRLGDICLLVSGFFPDSLNRKLIDIDYYFGMGGTAYWQLSQLQMTANARELFKELSTKFRAFSEVLGELSDRSGLQTNSDLLRIYEKWLLTGNDRLKTLLNEHGIVAIKFDVRTRH
jgi:tRNA G37 N-methylase Trm5